MDNLINGLLILKKYNKMIDDPIDSEYGTVWVEIDSDLTEKDKEKLVKLGWFENKTEDYLGERNFWGY